MGKKITKKKKVILRRELFNAAQKDLLLINQFSSSDKAIFFS